MVRWRQGARTVTTASRAGWVGATGTKRGWARTAEDSGRGEGGRGKGVDWRVVGVGGAGGGGPPASGARGGGWGGGWGFGLSRRDGVGRPPLGGWGGGEGGGERKEGKGEEKKGGEGKKRGREGGRGGGVRQGAAGRTGG
ncbi:UNVERIFIED_CONTAM: hypothetical protein DV099_10390 [Bifidobacterium longum]|nr:hypothetical protein [Bifidobacterium longum]